MGRGIGWAVRGAGAPDVFAATERGAGGSGAGLATAAGLEGTVEAAGRAGCAGCWGTASGGATRRNREISERRAGELSESGCSTAVVATRLRTPAARACERSAAFAREGWPALAGLLRRDVSH